MLLSTYPKMRGEPRLGLTASRARSIRRVGELVLPVADLGDFVMGLVERTCCPRELLTAAVHRTGAPS